MAVERMKMMDAIGDIKHIDEILIELLKLGEVSFVDTQREIDANHFKFNLDSEKNVERTIELNYVRGIDIDEKSQVLVREAKELMDFFEIRDIEDYYFKKVDITKDYEGLYNNLKNKVNRKKEIERNIKIILNLKKNYELFENVNIDLSALSNMEYFNVKFGILDRDARMRVKNNYGNILALIYHTGSFEDQELYICVYPKDVENEIERVLKSLNWQEVDIFSNRKGTARDILTALDEEEEGLKRELFEINEYRKNLLENDEEDLKISLAAMLISDEIESAKTHMLRSNHYFYISGWVGDSVLDSVKRIFYRYENSSVKFQEPSGDQKPPTKLKNLNFFKPFELLVNMYGTPNYEELDPTIIFGITYMILFGSMFGDLGQGAVFLTLGFLLSKVNKGFAGLLKRLGLSSIVFGILYGSVFGLEILTPLWYRPFSDINRTLVNAIYFGILLLALSYGVGIYNRVKKNEYFDAFFEKEGFLGFVVFVSMINLGMITMGAAGFIPKMFSIVLLVLSLVIMILKREILSRFFGIKQDGKASDYYIEGGFGILETLLSTMSGIISFIRVGAFAINHVGLFLAFQTLGAMFNSSAGNTIVLIIGNIIIIGLEGLIVFIQSLRLEYYEMFSKFYIGDGYLFKANKIKMEEN